jgi:hypothetical protein
LLSNTASFLVFASESPVVGVVGRGPGICEVVPFYSSVVDVRNVVVAYFVSVLQKDMYAVIVLDELAHFQGEGIGFSFVFIDPVIWYKK